MQKKIWLLLPLLFVLLAGALAQTRNPFKSIGQKADVLTLTNGKYDEFFDEDSIQRIGSVWVNINTMKVVKLQLTKAEEKLFDNSGESRFLSLDPLTAKFAYLTPYQLASNRPIEAIDLDGLEGWDLNTPTNKLHLDAQLRQQIASNVKKLQDAARANRVDVTENAPELKPADNSLHAQAQSQETERTRRIGNAMQEDAGGMGIAATFSGVASAPVDHAFGVYNGIQDRNWVKTSLNAVGLALDFSPIIFKGSGSVSFFSVQTEEDAARLAAGGVPWPTGPTRAHLGEGLYAWATKSEAQNYLDLIQKNSPGLNLKIMEFAVPKSTINSFKSFTVPKDDNLANLWLEKYSSLYGEGVDHGYQYIQRGTGIGTEHYFSPDAFSQLKLVK